MQAQLQDVSGRQFIFDLDTRSQNVRLQEGQLAYLFKLGSAQPIQVLFLGHKQYFNYDTGRANHWPQESRVARQARFEEVARKCRLQELQIRVGALLEHPCQLAIRFWGSHPPCQHQQDASGLEHWTHQYFKNRNRQTSFKSWTESLYHTYDPHRGLILAWDFTGLNQASGSNLQPQKESCEPSLFQPPADFQEAYSDKQLQEMLLPSLGEQHFSDGPPWRAAEDYQDQYSDRTYTRERWVWGGVENRELQIDRLLVGPEVNPTSSWSAAPIWSFRCPLTPTMSANLTPGLSLRKSDRKNCARCSIPFRLYRRTISLLSPANFEQEPHGGALWLRFTLPSTRTYCIIGPFPVPSRFE